MRSSLRFAWLALPLLLAMAMVVQAGEIRQDCFDVKLDATGVLDPTASGGTGFNGGEWYYYPNTGWYNQWFYNDPPRPFPYWKEIQYSMCFVGPVAQSYVEIAINWSTLLYPENPALPPLPPLDPILEEEWIHREIVYQGVPDGEVISGTIIIPDYNPEWVSIDVKGYDFTLSGCVIHQCIPEPATGLLLVGAGLVLLRRRRG